MLIDRVIDPRATLTFEVDQLVQRLDSAGFRIESDPTGHSFAPQQSARP